MAAIEDDEPQEPWEHAAHFVGDDEPDDVTWRGGGAHPELPPGRVMPSPDYEAWLKRQEQEEREQAIRDVLGDGPFIIDPDGMC